MFEVWGQKGKDKWRYEEGNLKPMEFATRAEAETFAGIEGTQMEGQGVKFTVVNTENKKEVCKKLDEAINDEQKGVEFYKDTAEYAKNQLPELPEIVKQLGEIKNDEAKHQDKLKEIKKQLICGV